jgi:hypothetical protein
MTDLPKVMFCVFLWRFVMRWDIVAFQVPRSLQLGADISARLHMALQHVCQSDHFLVQMSMPTMVRVIARYLCTSEGIEVCHGSCPAWAVM